MNHSAPLEPFVLISASRATWPVTANAESTAALDSQLAARGFDYVPVRGSYKNIEEDSFLVLCDPIADAYELGMLMSLARRYGQESIMLVDGNRHAALLNIGTGNAEALPGIFKAVPAHEARKLDAWTRRGGVYYAMVQS